MHAKTSLEWWKDIKLDQTALIDWLFDQYRGESTAAGRIRILRDRYSTSGTHPFRVLSVIADQEETHAGWVGGLLQARGQPIEIHEVLERYWPEVVTAVHDLQSGAAIGAHAERMRLERIEVIAADADAPADIREVFLRILPQERFHERAFRELAGSAALDAAADAQELGRQVLGLSP